MSDNTELKALKEQADDLGITYSAAIGVETLKQRIADYEARFEGTKEPVVATKPKKTQQELKAEAREAAMKLVRVRVSSLNPSRKEIAFEVFTAQNSIIPHVSRVVPMDNICHVEQILLNVIKNTKFTQSRQVKNGQGHLEEQRSLRNAYSVEVLPPLTAAELKDLAIQQAKRSTTTV